MEPTDTNQRVAFHRLKAAIASGLNEFSDAAKEMHIALQLAPPDPNLTLATAAAGLKANQLAPALEHARSSGDTAIASPSSTPLAVCRKCVLVKRQVAVDV